MQGIVKHHLDLFLAVCALCILAIAAGFFWWGMSAIFANVDRSFTADPPADERTRVDLEGAEAVLRARGMQ